MSIFNFKVVGHKAKEEKDYKISYVKRGQKPKVCGVCGVAIRVGEPATTFMKLIKYVTEEKKYITQHACGGHKNHLCTQKMAEQLNVTLP